MCAHIPYTHVRTRARTRKLHAVNARAYTIHARTDTCTHTHATRSECARVYSHAARTCHSYDCVHIRTREHTHAILIFTHPPIHARMHAFAHTRTQHTLDMCTHIPIQAYYIHACVHTCISQDSNVHVYSLNARTHTHAARRAFPAELRHQRYEPYLIFFEIQTYATLA